MKALGKGPVVNFNVNKMSMSQRYRLVINGGFSPEILWKKSPIDDLDWRKYLTPDGERLKNEPLLTTSYIAARIRRAGLSLDELNKEISDYTKYNITMNDIIACLIYAVEQGWE